jgi:hypothetical protein
MRESLAWFSGFVPDPITRKLALACAAMTLCGGATAMAQTLAISIGLRETGTTAAVGANGGTTGPIEFVNLDNLTLNLDGTWQQFTFHFGTDPVTAFTGNGTLDGTKGVLENIRLRNVAGITAPVAIYLDDVVNTVGGTPTTLTDFEGYPANVGGAGTEVMFQEPSFSGSSNTQIQAGSTHDIVTDAAHGGTQSDKFTWQWINNNAANWMRLTTFNTTNLPNPTIDWTSGNTLSFWLRGTVASVANKWIGPTNGNWNDAANWQSGNVPDTQDETANLLASTGPLTLVMDAPTVVNTVNFESVNKYTIAGSNALAFQGTAAGQLGNINVNLGSHEIAAPIEINSTTNISVVDNSTLTMSGGISVFGGNLIKLGNGTATISGAQDYSLGTGITVSSGTLNIGAFDSGGAVNDLATITVNSVTNGRLVADRVRVGTLAVGGLLRIKPNGTDSGTSVTRSFAITGNTDAWVGQVDLTNNKFVVDYTGASPLATIQNQLKSGYAGGPWTGKGIISSTSAADASSAHKTAIGFAEASALGIGSFGGQTVDADAVVMRYTLAGDNNLSGTVDLTDFTFLAANFNGAGKGWLQGDFNYDGSVDLTDFTFLAANFNQSLPASFTDSAAGSLGAAVPEPTAMALLVAAPMPALVMRRRARHRRTSE